MKGKKKKELRRKVIQNDRKINQRNKDLMIDKIFSYNPVLFEGVEAYKDANRNFTLLLFLGVLLVDFPIISLPCCILSMFFIVKMLQFIKYQSINNIVRELAKDLSFKGLYYNEKVDDMLNEFKAKYGDDVDEYSELVKMLNKYEELVTKIEYALNNINLQEEKKCYDKEIFMANGAKIPYLDKENNTICKEIEGSQNNRKKLNTYYNGDFNEKLSVLYKKEDGEIKSINKAIEFFETGYNDSYSNQNTVVLNNINKDNKKLTVYLYKKSPNLQKNAL